MNRKFPSIDKNGDRIPALSYKDSGKIRGRILERASPNYVLCPGEFARDINAEIIPVCNAIKDLVSEGALKFDPIKNNGWYLPAFRLQSLSDLIMADGFERHLGEVPA